MFSDDPAERHREIAGVFTDRVRGTCDWAAPAPVDGWTARNVVRHLVEWFPSFLRDGGVELGADGPSVADDPVGSWEAHVAAVQALLDAPNAERPFSHPYVGTHALNVSIDRFYTSDVFMHTWDLARATGQDETLDADEAATMLAGMQPIEALLRDSGQYGPRVPVPDDASVQDRLLGFIGRDPGQNPRTTGDAAIPSAP